MSKNKASAIWSGTLKDGNGKMKIETLGQELPYTFSSRFEDGKGVNPEELIAAAHAGCFSMAFSALLTEKGYDVESINTTAEVKLKKAGDGFKISESMLVTRVKVDNIKEEQFLDLADTAKRNCPVSQALSSVNISLKAALEG